MSVYDEVRDERAHQDATWGQQDRDPFTYLAILGEEYGESCQAAVDARFAGWPECPGPPDVSRLRAELIQVAAVAVAMVECIDRDKWRGWPGRK